MREVERIADELRRAHEGPAGYGPALRPILEEVTAEQARAHPAPGAHSIRELVGHIATWERAALAGIETGVVAVAEADNFPRAGEGEQGWRAGLEELERAYRALYAGILRLDDGALEGEVVSGEYRYSVYFLLHAAMQHAVYHAGQIVLLKRLLGA